MPDTKTVEICKAHIEKNIGSLEGLSLELKNTICNVIYNEVKNASNNNGNIDLSFEIESEKTELLKRMIASLREITRSEGRKEVKFITGLIIDEMKYGIKDSHRYSEVNRFVKRFLKRKKINEIEDLYKYFV